MVAVVEFYFSWFYTFSAAPGFLRIWADAVIDIGYDPAFLRNLIMRQIVYVAKPI